jgi:Zc3h12a-like ribonuclease protein
MRAAVVARARRAKDALPPRPVRPFTVVGAQPERRVILVDGANVAHEMHRNDQPHISNLWRVEGALQRLGYRPLLIIDANLRWKLSREDAQALERRRDEIVQAPAGVPADRTLLEYAARKGLSIVTNDRFREYEDDYPWIREAGRRVPYNIIGDEVLFYFPRPTTRPPRRDARGKAAPKRLAPSPPAVPIRARRAPPRTRVPRRVRSVARGPRPQGTAAEATPTNGGRAAKG